MHIKSLIFSFLLALGSFSFLQAQYLEAGFGVGASLYEGDLSPDSPLKRFQLLRPAGSAFVKWHLNPKFDWALNVNYLQLYGDDKKSDNAGRKERNLDFTSNVFEFNTTRHFLPIFLLELAYFTIIPKLSIKIPGMNCNP